MEAGKKRCSKQKANRVGSGKVLVLNRTFLAAHALFPWEEKLGRSVDRGEEGREKEEEMGGAFI